MKNSNISAFGGGRGWMEGATHNSLQNCILTIKKISEMHKNKMETQTLLSSETLCGLIWSLNHSPVQQNSLKDNHSGQCASACLHAHLDEPLQQSELLWTSVLNRCAPTTRLGKDTFIALFQLCFPSCLHMSEIKCHLQKGKKRGQKPI